MRTRFFLPVLAHVLAIIVVAPLLWVLVSALRPAEDVFSFGWPTRWTLDNLQYVLFKIPMPTFLMNSAIVSVVVTVVALFFHSMAAYALTSDELAALHDEIARYLATVDLFRREGCVPDWRPEPWRCSGAGGPSGPRPPRTSRR